MVIRTQDDSAIYDVDKLLSIYVQKSDDEEDTYYHVFGLSYAGEMAFDLGSYNNEERAKEVVGEIFALCNSSTLYEMPVV